MNISKDIKIIRELLNITQEELAKDLNVSFETISRWERGENDSNIKNINNVYSYAFSKHIFLNSIYEELIKEEYQTDNTKVLFHGCKGGDLVLPIDLANSKSHNDLGTGFYLGATYKQASAYIANSIKGNVYIFTLKTEKLKTYKFNVNREWMIAISYYRGWMDSFSNHPIIKKITEKVENNDVLIAPIADNRMFDIISEYVRGEITDLQCEHALAATNLGYQYVLKTDKALANTSLIQSVFVSDAEKKSIISESLNSSNISHDKVKVAKITYRGKGQYFDEVFTYEKT